MGIHCFNCSTAVQYPDARLRCDLDNHTTVEPCIFHTPGSPTFYEIEYQQLEGRVIKQKTKIQSKVKSTRRKGKTAKQGKFF